MSRKVFIVLLGLIMVFGLAACSNNNEPAPSADTDASKGNGSEQASGKPAEPLKIRVAYDDKGKAYVNASTNISEDQYVKELEKLTNTDLEFELIPHQEFEQSLTLLFAGGDLPDLIQTNGIDKPEVAPAVDAGAFTPLNDLIDQYGPNLKKHIPQEAWDSGTVSKDGVIYAIPQLQPIPNRLIFYVRKDWADQLNIKLPTVDDPFTVEETIDMLRKFKEANIGGNAIPVSGRERLRYMFGFFGAYDVIPDNWRLVNNELLPNFIRPEMKDALQTYRTLYQEGLLDNEIFVQSGDDWNNKIKSGRVGLWIHGAENADMWQTATREQSGIPTVDVVPFPAPVGPDGQGGSGIYSAVGGNKWVIPTSSKIAKELIQFLDRFYEEDVMNLVAWGIEGLDHTKESGEIKYIYDNGNQEIADRDAMHTDWLNFLGPAIIQNEKYMSGLPEGGRITESLKVSRSEGRINDGLDMPIPQTMSTRPELQWDGMFIEVAAKIITGRDDLTAFDAFVETWKSQGGMDAIKEATDWYNKQNK